MKKIFLDLKVQLVLVHTVTTYMYLPVSSTLVDRAVPVSQTDVFGVFLDGPLEESLAALAGPHPIVLTGGVVSADGAQEALGVSHKGAGRAPAPA